MTSSRTYLRKDILFMFRYHYKKSRNDGVVCNRWIKLSTHDVCPDNDVSLIPDTCFDVEDRLGNGPRPSGWESHCECNIDGKVDGLR